MQGDPFKSEQLEDRLQDSRFRSGELDELEAINSHGVGDYPDLAMRFHDCTFICDHAVILEDARSRNSPILSLFKDFQVYSCFDIKLLSVFFQCLWIE